MLLLTTLEHDAPGLRQITSQAHRLFFQRPDPSTNPARNHLVTHELMHLVKSRIPFFIRFPVHSVRGPDRSLRCPIVLGAKQWST